MRDKIKYLDEIMEKMDKELMDLDYEVDNPTDYLLISGFQHSIFKCYFNMTKLRDFMLSINDKKMTDSQFTESAQEFIENFETLHTSLMRLVYSYDDVIKTSGIKSSDLEVYEKGLHEEFKSDKFLDKLLGPYINPMNLIYLSLS